MSPKGYRGPPTAGRAFRAPIMKRLLASLLTLAAILPLPALAGPGDPDTATGSSTARVVEPLDIQELRDLRFGAFIRPTAAGTVTISTGGGVATSGGLDPTLFPSQRGAATFLVHGRPNRQFITYLPTSITIRSGTNTMRVDQFRKNGGVGPNQLDLNGYHLLQIGGRLNVGANQAVGHYSGTFTVQVLYL